MAQLVVNLAALARRTASTMRNVCEKNVFDYGELFDLLCSNAEVVQREKFSTVHTSC